MCIFLVIPTCHENTGLLDADWDTLLPIINVALFIVVLKPGLSSLHVLVSEISRRLLPLP